MNERFSHLKKILERALEVPDAERVAYVEAACGDDTELLREALALLAYDSEDADSTVRYEPEQLDTEIGPYRLLERLGEGAMGEVWRAEQRTPIKRIVALKIIKRGMDTREVITRFEIERQAMALMDHPWIAKVYDAGQTRTGRPYIAMEYVAGERLTDHCERNRLTIEDRLLLFQKVCLAVQHAHQKAVIHRDLKPSNILVVEVDGKPVPKIIDFGIAKATAQRLTDRSAATFVGQLIGTPFYMSPEQVEMSAAGVDTRADVYSLGVILYELISGTLPHDPQRLAKAAFHQILKVLCEDDPERPSTRVSTLGDRTAEIAAQRGLDPKKLVRTLRGDLDWLTLKALEKDRKRRYETPQHLAEDIGRYLQREVIQARPPSTAYRFSRFVRRNAAAVMIAGSAVLALVAFALWQTYQNDMITHERDLAVANERLSIARSYVEADPTMAIAHAISSLEVLDRPEARDVVRQAFLHGELRDEFPADFGRGNAISVDASRDGGLLAVARSQTEVPTVDIMDLESQSLRELRAPTSGFTYDVLFSKDASHVAAVAVDGVHVWRMADGEHVFHEPFDFRERSTLLIPSNDETIMLLVSTAMGSHPEWYVLDLNGLVLRTIGISAGRFGEGVQSHRPSMDPDMQSVLDYEGTRIFLQNVTDLDVGPTRAVGIAAAAISAVALDPMRRFAVSVDVEGEVLVFDLRMDPPELVRQYNEPPGSYELEVDPGRFRFLSLYGSPTSHLYAVYPDPPRTPVPLLDRTHWTHDGTFLPDGSIITSRNGVPEGPLAHWRRSGPVLWSLDREGYLGSDAEYRMIDQGRSLLVWTTAGKIHRISTLAGANRANEVLGRTPAWRSGMDNAFLVQEQLGVALFVTPMQEGFTLLDLDSGAIRVMDPFEDSRQPLDIEPARGAVAFVDYEDVREDGHEIQILELDSGEVKVTLRPEGEAYRNAAFTSPDSLVCLGANQVVRFSLDHPQAVPDTLWQGDARGGARLLDGGHSMVVRSAKLELRWVEFGSGREVLLEENVSSPVSCADLDATGRYLAFGTWRSGIQVHDLQTGEVWRLPVLAVPAFFVGFDPLGRWLLVETTERVDAWELPLDPIFSDLDPESFMERCQDLTNVRVIPDATSETGFRITNLSGNWREPSRPSPASEN